MKFGSVCSGIGGMDHGLEMAGLEPAWQIENHPRAQAVLRHRFPGIPLYADLLKVDPDELTLVHLIAGGTPCQDLSVAGRGAGLDGERSSLFFRFVALADSQPRALVLWENVPGALSSREGLDFARVLGELTGYEPGVPPGGWRNSGFGVGPKRWACWRVLDSQHFGVAQERRRVFVVAGSCERPCPEILFEPEGMPWDSEEGGTTGAGASGAAESGPGVGGLPGRVGTLGAQSDGKRGSRVGADEAAAGAIVVARCLTAKPGYRSDFESETLLPIPYHLAQITSSESRANPQPGAPAPTLNADPRLAVVYAVAPGGAANGRETRETDTARTLGTDRGFQAGPGGTLVAYACQGSNVGPMGTLCSGNGHVTGGVPFLAGTLTRRWDSGEDGTGRVTLVPEEMGVRRLTPVEYERLQGLPDDWTRRGRDDSGQVFELKDAPRYMGCGNAVTATVACWIGRRILATGILDGG